MVVSCEKQGDDEVQYILGSYDCVNTKLVSWIGNASLVFPLVTNDVPCITFETKVEGTLSFEVKEKMENQRVENGNYYYYERPWLSIEDENGQSLLYLSDESEKEEVILGKEITCLVPKNTVIIFKGELVTISNIKISEEYSDFDF